MVAFECFLELVVISAHELRQFKNSQPDLPSDCFAISILLSFFFVLSRVLDLLSVLLCAHMRNDHCAVQWSFSATIRAFSCRFGFFFFFVFVLGLCTMHFVYVYILYNKHAWCGVLFDAQWSFNHKA